MIILFYANHNIAADIIRDLTREKGEAFAAVPNHCALFKQGLVYEATFPLGVTYRPWADADTDYLKRFDIPLPNVAATDRYIAAMLGRPYDWRALAVWLVDNDALPEGYQIVDRNADADDCSRFVMGALVAGGIPLKMLDPSPNALMMALERL